MSDEKNGNRMQDGFSRRTVLGMGSAALAAATLAGFTAHAQTREGTRQAEGDHSSSNPGQENSALLAENPNSNTPPPTDNGDVGPIWYSFDLTKKRIQEGGWTHQVTQRELPSSTDLAGVNMRLTAGSFRELHWHTADEWSIMLYGNARVTVLNPDGTIFIDDVSKGDLWYFPAGYPHSIQGLGPDGCEFLLVFDQGMFSFFFSSRRRHTIFDCDWSSDVCSSDLVTCVWSRSAPRRRISIPASTPGRSARSTGSTRSEERRVGKECRSRWSPYH